MDSLLGETLNKALLDSGCTKTVCGEEWLKYYLESLPEADLERVREENSGNVFKFGNDKLFKSKKLVHFPCVIGNRRVLLSGDVVECHIPLLLSKKSMKKANTRIDFKSDVVEMFGAKVDLTFTSSGHYCISLCNSSDIAESVLLSLSSVGSVDEKYKLAKKIHRQFGHASAAKIIRLLVDAGVDDLELHKFVRDLDYSLSEV